MINLKSLSDDELETEGLRAVKCETNAGIHVLHVLAEVERRRLYSKKYPTLHEYCVKVYKYDGGKAQRRIDAMRAMKIIPQIENKIVSGELNLTVISQAQSFFRQEAKAGKKYSVDQKIEVFEKLENKSTRDVIKELVTISPHAIPKEKRRQLTVDKTELKVVIDQALVEKLDKIKALLSNKHPHLTDSELINELAEIALKKLDPTAPKKDMQKKTFPAPEVQKEKTITSVTTLGYVSAYLTRLVFHRDQSRCTHPGCGSRFFLEVDHIKPQALGGETTLENLRLLCRTHNQNAAIAVFGKKHMSKFIPLNI